MKYENQNQKIYSSMIENARHFQLKFENKLPTYQYKIPVHRVQEYLELYHWRTQFKHLVIALEWIKVEPENEKEVIIFLKSINNLSALSQIKNIRGCNLMKNVGKIFTSFQLLFNKFGPFELSPKMICFDEFYEPFVWMHSDHFKNEYKRDYVSEAQFGQNIIKILLKYSDKFQIKQFEEHCCLVKGEERTLNEMSNHFNNFKQRQNNEADRKFNDQNQGGQCILTFSKISRRKKKKTNSFSNSKSQNSINNKVVKSYLRLSQKTENQLNSEIHPRIAQEKTNSTTSSIPQFHVFAEPSSLTIPSYIQNSANNIAFNTRKDLCKSYCLEDVDPTNQDQFTNHRNELAISIMNPDSEQSIMKEIIELPQLDKYQKKLVKSIIQLEK